MVVILPTYKGYTIDMRLREFRKVSYNPPSIEFIPFSSPKGKKLWGEIVKGRAEGISPLYTRSGAVCVGNAATANAFSVPYPPEGYPFLENMNHSFLFLILAIENT